MSSDIQQNDGSEQDKELQWPTISDTRKRIFLHALTKNLGIVSQASRASGIARSTHYDWMVADADYAKAVKEVGEFAIDFVEGKLLELINGVTIQDIDKKGKKVIYQLAPNTAATIFFLKTKAKSRGYIERVQLEELSDKDIDSTLDF